MHGFLYQFRNFSRLNLAWTLIPNGDGSWLLLPMKVSSTKLRNAVFHCPVRRIPRLALRNPWFLSGMWVSCHSRSWIELSLFLGCISTIWAAKNQKHESSDLCYLWITSQWIQLRCHSVRKLQSFLPSKCSQGPCKSMKMVDHIGPHSNRYLCIWTAVVSLQ